MQTWIPACATSCYASLQDVARISMASGDRLTENSAAKRSKPGLSQLYSKTGDGTESHHHLEQFRELKKRRAQ
jgi:hypothetical protein